jgi:rhodanese-related sulfurtransferase
MYHSTRDKLMKLPHNVVVYPAHGPGSLCGKNMSPDLQSTIGRELRENYALQLMDELQFVKTLTTDQPFVPKYFGHDVEINKKGAPSFNDSVAAVLRIGPNDALNKNILVIDTRPKQEFRNGYLKGAINLQDGDKFETWLGSIVNPGEQFYLIAANAAELDTMIKKAAKIGYEQNIKAALLNPATATEKLPDLDLANFVHQTENYTVVDVRNRNETEEGLIFKSAITIPLPELRERISEIPTGKPIVVHCAAGYRSAAAVSIIKAAMSYATVYDLGEAVVEIANQQVNS